MIFGKLMPKICYKNVIFNVICKLHVHENISFGLLSECGIPVPKFGIARTPEEAYDIADNLKISSGLEDFVVKAQVLTGGRGKGIWLNESLKGGVKIVFSPAEVKETASKMLGNYLKTAQTGENGLICNEVLICERKYQRKEYYISLMMERSYNGPVLITSPMGGIHIEEVAKEYPHALYKNPINILHGINDEVALSIAEKLEFGNRSKEVAKIFVKMYRMFLKYDLVLLEINPFAEVSTGEKFRQKNIFYKRDLSQEDEKEVAASHHQLNYIALHGNIGCLVNGAGLAMATMDIIKLHGGEPANFLDIGGTASINQVKEAFKIITSDPKVDAILVNIFGGIMRCDIIALGVLEAAKDLHLEVPIVVRLQGTNVENAKALIAASAVKIIACDNIDEAAIVVVKASNIVSIAKSIKLSVQLNTPLF